MTANSIRNEINNLIVYLLENELAIDVNNAIIRHQNSEYFVSWATSPKSPMMEIRGDFTSISEYRSIIEKRLYHILFQDGAAFQFGYIFSKNKMIQHRLCYYPCPLKITSGDLEYLQQGEDFLAYFDLLLDHESEKIINQIKSQDFYSGTYTYLLRSPIRCDYSPNKAKKDHPFSHMHFNHSESRIPIYGPLPFGQFVKFIFRHFYPDIWKDHEKIRKWPVQSFFCSIKEEEKSDMYFNVEYK